MYNFNLVCCNCVLVLSNTSYYFTWARPNSVELAVCVFSMSLIQYLVTRMKKMRRMLFQKLLGQVIMLSLECFLHKPSVCNQLFESFNSIH